MPSLYEPCGLTQMRAMRYGTVPIARAVGGLVDSIEDGVSGFLFTANTPEALDREVRRAAMVYEDQPAWHDYMVSAMRRNFGWERSANQYHQTYLRAIAAHAGAR